MEGKRRASTWKPVARAAAATGVLMILLPGSSGAQNEASARARANARQFERAVEASRKVLQAWLAHADPETLLLPDRPLPDRSTWIYTPPNSGADPRT